MRQHRGRARIPGPGPGAVHVPLPEAHAAQSDPAVAAQQKAPAQAPLEQSTFAAQLEPGGLHADAAAARRPGHAVARSSARISRDLLGLAHATRRDVVHRRVPAGRARAVAGGARGAVGPGRRSATEGARAGTAGSGKPAARRGTTRVAASTFIAPLRKHELPTFRLPAPPPACHSARGNGECSSALA